MQVYVHNVHAGAQELSGPLKLELQAITSYLIWVRGTEAESSAKVPNC